MATLARQGSEVERWSEAQRTGDGLWQIVRPGAMYDRPVPERHRLIFYLGHLEAFDWNLLAPVLDLRPFHPEWDQLFAFGIDPVEGELPSEPAEAWPNVVEVLEYNRRIREKLQTALEAQPRSQETATRLEVALEHRWMHVETLAYLVHNLGYEKKAEGPAPIATTNTGGAMENDAVGVSAGLAQLGQHRNGAFGWDNEFEAHAVEVGAFAAQRYKVTNGEYLRFVQAGAPPPHFWRWDERLGWKYRGMFGEVPLPLDHPVYVTHAEASAYAGWAGRKLPTEAQWHRMAYGDPGGEDRAYPWGAAAEVRRGNFGLQSWDPVAVTAHPDGASAWGIEDLLGNGWEWTATPFGPFPGFAPHSFYPGYSANFFDGKHFVLKGASARTAVCLTRRSFRNWFQPNYPHVYAGFRCVTN